MHDVEEIYTDIYNRSLSPMFSFKKKSSLLTDYRNTQRSENRGMVNTKNISEKYYQVYSWPKMELGRTCD